MKPLSLTAIMLCCHAALPVSTHADPNVCIRLEHQFQAGGSALLTPQLSAMLFTAADHGCVEIAPRLIRAGASVATRDRTGGVPLTHAARAGRVDMIRLLLADGAAINQPDLQGTTPLLAAVQANQTEASIALIEAGSDIDAPGRSLITPLIAAAFNGNRQLVDMLLSRGADPAKADGTGKPAILYAAARGYGPVVIRLLDAGIDVNKTYANGLTLLSWAAGHTNEVPDSDAATLIDQLLVRGARVDPVDDRGQTPAMIAASMGHAATAQRLLARDGALPQSPAR